MPFPANKELYVGIDIGRKKDLTVFWVLEKVNDHCFTRSVISLQDTPFSEQFSMLESIMQSSSVKRCCIDQTGLGRQFTEQAIKRFGAGRIEGIHFSNTMKESLAYPVKTKLEEKKLTLPCDNTIRSDLHSIKKEITSAGNIRLMASHTDQGHADHFWALALSLHASAQAPAYFYQKINKQS